MTRISPSMGVDLWLADPSACRQPALHRRFEALLTEAERAQHARFLFERDRDRFLMTRATVRTVLAQYLDTAPMALVFNTNPWGKPALQHAIDTHTPLTFNVSHTHRLIALAVSTVPSLGIDLEDTRRAAPLHVAERCLSTPEKITLQGLTPSWQAHHFWTLWTLKESYVKALGIGLQQPLDSFSFHFDPILEGSPISFTAPSNQPHCDWWFGSWHATQQHVLALCVAWDHPTPPHLRTRLITPLHDISDCTLKIMRSSR